MVRTQRRLQESLLALIVEKGYDRVTVQDILDRADVGRSTFYSHFMNKTDLLMGNMRADSFRLAPPASPAEIPSVAWLFEHAGEHLTLYRALVDSEAIPHVYRNINEGLQQNWKEILGQMKAEGAPIAWPIDATASYLSHALIGLLSWWLDNRMPYAEEEMDALYQGMIRRGVFGEASGG